MPATTLRAHDAEDGPGPTSGVCADGMFRHLVERMAEGAGVLSSDGRMLYANAQLMKILGVSTEQLVGQSVASFVAADSQRELAQLVDHARGATAQLRLRRPGGTEVPVSVTTDELQVGGVPMICLTVSDRSEEERRTAELRMQAHMLDAVGEAIIATDTEGVITYANAAATQLYGWDHDDMVGRPVAAVTVNESMTDQATEIFQQLLEGRSWSGEFTVRRSDGSAFPAQVTDTPIIDHDGRLTGIIGISRDITRRRAAEERIAASEQWFRGLVQHASELILVVDEQARKIYANPASEQMLGWAPDVKIGEDLRANVHPDDREAVDLIFAACVRRGGMVGPVEFRVANADGDWRAISAVAVNCLDDPAITGIVINAHNVTEANAARDALARSEALLREAQRISHVGHWQWDITTDRLEWLGEELHAIHGVSPDRWTTPRAAYTELIPASDRAAFNAAVDAALEGGESSVTHRILRPDGQVRHVRNRFHTEYGDTGQPVCMTGTCQDVTESEELRVALQERVKELSCLLSVNTAAQQVDGLDGLCRTITHALPPAMRCQKTASCLVEVDGRRWGDADPATEDDVSAPVVVAGVRRGRVAVTCADPEGVFLPEEQTMIDSLAATLGLWLERHESVAALAESEARFRRLAEHLPDLIVRVDRDLRWIYVNSRLTEMTGKPAAAFLGKRPEQLGWPADLARRWVQVAEEVYRSAEPATMDFDFPVSGDGRYLQTLMIPEFDNEGEIDTLLAVTRDLTELRRAEKDRLKAVGRIVQAQEEERRRIGEDIHDDSIQAMTVVSLRLATLGRHLVDPDLLEQLGTLKESVSRSITRLRTLMFALRPAELDREGLAPALRVFLQSTCSENLLWRVSDRCASPLPVELRPVLYRIAQEAISNTRKHAKAELVEVFIDDHDGGVRMMIRDSGCGFDQRAIAAAGPHHIGTTAMRERAQLAGGSLTIDSQPGGGTTVSAWLPFPPDEPELT